MTEHRNVKWFRNSGIDPSVRNIATLHHKSCGRWIADLELTVGGMTTLGCYRPFPKGDAVNPEPRLPFAVNRRRTDEHREDYSWALLVFSYKPDSQLHPDDMGWLVASPEDDWPESDGVLPHLVLDGSIEIVCDKCELDVSVPVRDIRRFARLTKNSNVRGKFHRLVP